MSILPNGSIFLREVDKSDSGVYNCLRQNSVLDLKGSVNLTVRCEFTGVTGLFFLTNVSTFL